MKTKQEIIDFLESKVGTKVVCVGNTTLNGQCVSLIKALMEFLGVPEPYKARGHAKDCIAKYLSEGIAKPGLGFISVFSNKDMAKGVGHIWCNAGEGNGTFYESNGAKPLIVTKGKSYTYDNVCNFDSYISEDTYRGYDLNNKESMKVCVDQQIKVVEGQLIDKSQYEAVKGQLTESTKNNEFLSEQLGSARSELKTALDSAKTAKEALQKELSDQLDYADKWEDEQNAHAVTKNLLSNTLWDIEDSLKLSHPSDDMDSRISVALGALQSQIQTNVSYEKQVKDLESKNTKLNKYKVGIDKLSIKECIMLIIDKILKRS